MFVKSLKSIAFILIHPDDPPSAFGQALDAGSESNLRFARSPHEPASWAGFA